MSEEEDVYLIWSVNRSAESKPGEVERVNVRARTELAARISAAVHRGEESEDEWRDPTKSTATPGPQAKIQRSGIVQLWAHGWTSEARMRFTTWDDPR